MYYYLNCVNKEVYLGEIDGNYEEKELLSLLKEQKIVYCKKFYHNNDNIFNRKRYTAEQLEYLQVKYSKWDKPFYVNMDTIVSVSIVSDNQQERQEKFNVIHTLLNDEIGTNCIIDNKKVQKVLFKRVCWNYSCYEAVGKLTKEIKKDRELLTNYYMDILFYLFLYVQKDCNQEYLTKTADDLDKVGYFKTKALKEKFLKILL